MKDPRWPGLGDVDYYIGSIVQRTRGRRLANDLNLSRFNAKFMLEKIDEANSAEELARLRDAFQELGEVLERERPLVRDIDPLISECRSAWEYVRENS